MTGITLPAACLCLMTGALLGMLFLACKLVRGLLYGGRICTAVMDILFCLIWAVTAFLCALVVDKGRLRMLQMVLQVLGAWGAVVALDPFVNGVTSLVRRFGIRLGGWISYPARLLRKRLRAVHAEAKQRRAQKRKADKMRKKQARGNGSGMRNKPRYRKRAAKSKRYAPKLKKTKNPLEKLT